MNTKEKLLSQLTSEERQCYEMGYDFGKQKGQMKGFAIGIFIGMVTTIGTILILIN